jgi:glyoxylase-like metal-dependent hydrolase (beta-lactamase superfamily II)
MRELAPGLWHWQGRHPGWSDGEPWDPSVSSYAIDDGERLLVFDPIAPPDEILELAGDRDTMVVLTAPWHERDLQILVERLGVPVYSPRPDSAQDLMDKWGITAEQAGDGSPDLVWLRAEAADHWRPYAADGPLPSGLEGFEGREPNDVVLWVESRHAVVSGDTLADFGNGLELSSRWLREGMTWESRAERLRPLLDKPVERVLAAHGGPFDRAALERALSSPSAG